MALPKSKQKSMSHLYREQEELRLEHNKMGRHFREKEITKNKWQTYLKASFRPRSYAISKEIGETRNKLLSQFNFALQPLTSINTKYPAHVNTDEKRMHYLLVLTHKLENVDIDNPLHFDALNKMIALKEKFKHGS